MIASFQTGEKTRANLEPPHGGIPIRKSRFLKAFSEFHVFIESRKELIERTVKFAHLTPHSKVMVKSEFTFELSATKWRDDQIIDLIRDFAVPVPDARIIRPNQKDASPMPVDLI